MSNYKHETLKLIRQTTAKVKLNYLVKGCFLGFPNLVNHLNSAVRTKARQREFESLLRITSERRPWFWIWVALPKDMVKFFIVQHILQFL